MKRTVTVAVLQAELGGASEDNVALVERLAREAAAAGAQVLVPPELFEHAYFPKTVDPACREYALPVDGHPTLERFAALAAELEVVIPVSFYESVGERLFNSVAIIDADGSVLGVYRKTHIPEGPGYEEKYYFEPGDVGFPVWNTRYVRLGVGVCWDQWFPECARALTLGGAELLVFPSAIGSEPERPEIDTRAPWQRVMVGHAVANTVPLAASNRIGEEDGQEFYGCSFISDQLGYIVAELDHEESGFDLATFDLDLVAYEREWMGLLRDRRPEAYVALTEPSGGASDED